VSRLGVNGASTPAERAEALRLAVAVNNKRDLQQEARQCVKHYGIVPASIIREERVLWLWEGYVPRGAFTILEGDPEAGKTTVALSIAATVSVDGPFPAGRTDPDPESRAAVLYLTAEDSLSQTIVGRLKAAGADLTRILVQRPKGAELILPKALKHLKAIVLEEGVNVLVLDPLNAYLDASSINVNSEQDVRRALRPVRDLAEELHLVVLGVRHFNKATDKPAMYRGAGSIALTAVARSVLLVARHPEDRGLRILLSQKCNLIEDEKRLPRGFRIGKDSEGRPRVEWLAEEIDIDAEQLLAPRKPGPKPDTLEKAKGYLKDHLQHGPKLRRDLLVAGEKLGLNEKALERAARALRIRSTAQGREREWSL